MFPEMIADRLSVHPQPAKIVLLFFAYSFLGYVVECIVLTVDKRTLVLNRGFARHLPFCVIYGFGAMAGYALLKPLAGNLVLLFLAGAVGATAFEYLVGRLQMRLFGDFWWDYTEKRFNYAGIVCLESTVGWGAGALFVILFLHEPLAALVSAVPSRPAAVLAALLGFAYLGDFAFSARRSWQPRREELEPNAEPGAELSAGAGPFCRK